MSRSRIEHSVIERMNVVHRLVDKWKLSEENSLLEEADRMISPILIDVCKHQDKLPKPLLTDVYATYANICEKKGHLDKACRLWKNAMDTNPFCWITRLSYITSLRKTRAFDLMEDAFKSLEDDIAAAPTHEKPSQEFIAKLFNAKAIYYVEQAAHVNVKRALSYAQEAVRANPNYAPTWSTLGHIYDYLEDHRNKEKCFYEAYQRNPDRFQKLHGTPSSYHHGVVTAGGAKLKKTSLATATVPAVPTRAMRIRKSRTQTTTSTAPTTKTILQTTETKDPIDAWSTPKVVAKPRTSIVSDSPNVVVIGNPFNGLRVNYKGPKIKEVIVEDAIEEKKSDRSTTKKSSISPSQKTKKAIPPAPAEVKPRQNACTLWQKRVGEGLAATTKRVSESRDQVCHLAHFMWGEMKKSASAAMHSCRKKKSPRELHVEQIRRRHQV